MIDNLNFIFYSDTSEFEGRGEGGLQRFDEEPARVWLQHQWFNDNRNGTVTDRERSLRYEGVNTNALSIQKI